jgi:hypothetical protein
MIKVTLIVAENREMFHDDYRETKDKENQEK